MKSKGAFFFWQSGCTSYPSRHIPGPEFLDFRFPPGPIPSKMSSDPRVHKPRVPKAYSDEQLTFLRRSVLNHHHRCTQRSPCFLVVPLFVCHLTTHSHLSEFERRSQGSIRGDAKKFALERAQDFITRFGLPSDYVGVDESEPRFREQIYNWFKNTVGRTRRKLEGRPRSAKKVAEKGAFLGDPVSNHLHDRLFFMQRQQLTRGRMITVK